MYAIVENRLRELEAQQQREAANLHEVECSLRAEIKGSQMNLEEYALQASIEEEYLEALRSRLEEVGEAIDAEARERARSLQALRMLVLPALQVCEPEALIRLIAEDAGLKVVLS